MPTRAELMRYYGPALSDPTQQPPYYTQQPQKLQSNQGVGLGPVAFGAAAVIGAGAIPFGKGRVADKYISAIRHVEEYSPGQILRTFQVSNYLSQFGTTPATRLAGQTLADNRQYATYLASLIGEGRATPSTISKFGGVYGRLISEGVTLRGGSLYWGAGEEVALRHARAMTTLPDAGARLGAAYARSLNVPVHGTPLHQYFAKEAPLIGGLPGQIVGGHTRRQAAYRQAAGLGTELVGRFNRLLELPFEMGPLKPLYQKFTKATGFSLAVKDTGGARMFGRLAAKYGLILPAAYMAYQTADYWARQAEALDKTVLAEGITAGIATVGIRANLAASRTADFLGLHNYREAQEEIAPTSTNLTTLMGFPLVGAMAAGTVMYGAKVARQAQFQAGGMALSEAREAAGKLFTEWPEKGPLAAVGKWFADRPGGLIGKLGKMTPGRLGVLGAAGLGLAAITPFIPGALIPGKRPEELEALYSGEELEPLRKGKWWMFGRSAFEGERILTYKQHWYPEMLQRAREKAIWREDLTGEEMSPLEKFYKREFTYELEDLHGRDRPYPVSGTPFQDVPFVGPVLAATLGRFIKPERYQFADEWMTEEGQRLPAPGFGGRVATELGEEPGGMAVSRHRLDQVIGEQAYRMTEMIGLPGFTFGSIKKALTGREEFFDEHARLQTAERIGTYERKYWEMELGDPAGVCFAPGTEIKLEDNVKCIEDVEVGDRVLTHGEFKRVVDKLIKSNDKRLLSIRSISGGVTLKCTENHWIPVLRRHKYNTGHTKPFNQKNYSVVEIQAKDIQKGDYLFYEIDKTEKPLVLDLKGCSKAATDQFVYLHANQERAECWEAIMSNPAVTRAELRCQGFNDVIAKDTLRNFRLGKLPTRFKRFLMVDKDLAYAIGWYIAEGSSDSSKFSYAMDAKEYTYATEIAAIFHRLGIKTSIAIRDNRLELNVYSSVLARAFKQFGESSHRKHIPVGFKNLPKPELQKLLSGLILGDGWSRGFTSVSTTLVRDIFDGLLKLGIASNVYLDYMERATGLLPQGTARQDSLRSYLRLLKSDQSWRFFDHSFLVKVSDVTELSEHHKVVYDLTIEDLHHYTAEGVRVHNTEAYRRLFPHRRRRIEEVNPIRNTMASWLPGPGERGPNLQYGDPFEKIPYGETRLPGPGYEVRYPELRGLGAENYPDIHKFSILADIGRYTDKFDQARIAVRKARRNRDWGDYEESIYQRVNEQLKEQREDRFAPYRYLSPTGEIFDTTTKPESGSAIAAINEMEKAGEKEPGVVERTFGGYWELLAHNAELATENLTPFAPAAKFIHQRTAIEEYEKQRVFGTKSAFWDRPWENFLKPFMNMVAAGAGDKDIPNSVQMRRDIETHFDMLKYVKNARLANLAREAKDYQSAKEFEQKKDETLFGVNPYTMNFTSLYRSLPRAERDYFKAFSEAQTPEEQKRILSLVPENEQALYAARWKLANAQKMRKAVKEGVLSEDQVEEANTYIEKTYDEARTEGLPSTKELTQEYLATKLPGENYADWYRRTKLLPETSNLPGPNWVGWHPSVDLEDIKMKLVQEIGANPFEYNLWPSRARRLPYKPYIDAEAIEPLVAPTEVSKDEIRSRINQLLANNEISGHTFITPSYVGEINVRAEQDVDLGPLRNAIEGLD